MGCVTITSWAGIDPASAIGGWTYESFHVEHDGLVHLYEAIDGPSRKMFGTGCSLGIEWNQVAASPKALTCIRCLGFVRSQCKRPWTVIHKEKNY